MFGLKFEPQIDIGHFLTFITLVVGFLGAGLNAIRSWRKKARKDAESGALRLLLHILRQRGSPISLPDLMEEFELPKRRKLRKTYCGRDWHFKDKTEFEAAVYQLDWEGKIDFVSPEEITFRLDRHRDVEQRFHPNDRDAEQMLRILRNAAMDPNVNTWDLKDIVDSSMRIAPQATATFLREMLHDSDPAIHGRAAAIIGRFIPDAFASTSSVQSSGVA